MFNARNGVSDVLQKKSGTQTIISFDRKFCCRHKATRTNDHAERENQPDTSPSFVHGTESSS